MRYRFELSAESQRQLSRFPREVQERLAHAIDDLESPDDSQWSNVKALQGVQLRGRFRKKVGPSGSSSGSSPTLVSRLGYPHQIERHLSVSLVERLGNRYVSSVIAS
jgi:hypothetical protein